jgi:acetolactate synthase-1/3 small subunit
MSDVLDLELDHLEGSLPRVIGLIERRGFFIDALTMKTGNHGRVLSLTIRPRDTSRSVLVLKRQIDRLYGLRRLGDTHAAEESFLQCYAEA